VRIAGPSAELTAAAAISRIDLQQGLVTSADVRLGTIEPRYLAHELEHVLEQIDGVNLRSAARRGVRGVATDHRTRFETARAISVAAQVTRELDLRPQQPGNQRRKSMTHRGG
jgi:hypothetical protein